MYISFCLGWGFGQRTRSAGTSLPLRIHWGIVCGTMILQNVNIKTCMFQKFVTFLASLLMMI
ncbi:unnamed protein product [Coffea canephora]|uniref:Uncharacterized protein n=1 Tax=Coffea canephora TaxID=49390 RepID=A0A068TN40_COFCA|nr:unnamed protein product [Coffea canephora]